MSLILNDHGNLTNLNEVFHIEEDSSTVETDLNEVMHIEDQSSKKAKKPVDLRETINLELEDAQEERIIEDLNE